jgi:hypothetical protein
MVRRDSKNFRRSFTREMEKENREQEAKKGWGKVGVWV